jgi:hypothetical protein
VTLKKKGEIKKQTNLTNFLKSWSFNKDKNGPYHYLVFALQMKQID